MSEVRRLRNLPISYFLTTVAVVVFSLGAAYLEYNYILFDSVPYREAELPAFGIFYNYQFLLFFPILVWLAFQPFIQQIMLKVRSSEDIRRTLALGLANAFLGIMLEDAGWFFFRLVAPVASDPLAYQWIRPSDYTSSAIGFASILGAVIPLWYFVLLIPVAAIFAALVISPSM